MNRVIITGCGTKGDEWKWLSETTACYRRRNKDAWGTLTEGTPLFECLTRPEPARHFIKRISVEKPTTSKVQNEQS